MVFCSLLYYMYMYLKKPILLIMLKYVFNQSSQSS